MGELEPIIREIFTLLGQRNWCMATVESCTAGMIAAVITDISGSSTYFDRGFATYSNQAKVEMVGVDPAIIETHGAVSEETARHMALGGVHNSQANIAVAVTGIAGPGGGSVDKPVGTVCIATATADHVIADQYHFDGDRRAVRHQATEAALTHMLSVLKV